MEFPRAAHEVAGTDFCLPQTALTMHHVNCATYREVDHEKWTEMENTLYGMERPIVLDLKLGTQTWHPGVRP